MRIFFSNLFLLMDAVLFNYFPHYHKVLCICVVSQRQFKACPGNHELVDCFIFNVPQ